MTVAATVVFGAMLLASTGAGAAELTVEGNLEVFRGDAKTNEFIRAFRASIHDCEILIHVDPGRNEPFEQIEFASDGTNSAFFIKYLEPTKLKPSAPKPRNDSTVEVRLGVTPPAIQGMTATPVWLAYGSGCYFRERQERLVDCLFMLLPERLRERSDQLKLRADWKLADGTSPMLESFADYCDGIITPVDGSPDSPWPLELATGRTNSIFRVQSWTNVSHIVVPTVFSYTLYKPADEAAPAANPPLRIITTIRGFARRVSAGIDGASLFPTTLTKATRVIDHRVLEEKTHQPSVYIATNGVLLTPSQLAERFKTANIFRNRPDR